MMDAGTRRFYHFHARKMENVANTTLMAVINRVMNVTDLPLSVFQVRTHTCHLSLTVKVISQYRRRMGVVFCVTTGQVFRQDDPGGEAPFRLWFRKSKLRSSSDCLILFPPAESGFGCRCASFLFYRNKTKLEYQVETAQGDSRHPIYCCTYRPVGLYLL